MSVVTDQIDRFTPEGILTKSGELLEADIIITATGFNLCPMGDIAFEVNGKPVNFGEVYTYHGMMCSGVPNMAMMFGYLRTSWTMRVDLVNAYVCRLLNHMDEIGAGSCTPTLREQDKAMGSYDWVDEEDFNAGYMQRGKHLMPRRGDHAPWTFTTDYYIEKDMLPALSLDDDALVYEPAIETLAEAQQA